MNIAAKQQSRRRRQAQGRKQEQPKSMPGMENLSGAPLTFTYTPKEEHEQRTNIFMPPAYDPNELTELPTSYKPDTELNPLSFSDFYAEGMKIRPWAHIRVPSYLAVSEWEGVDDSDFETSWIVNKGEFAHLVSQYVGQQHPIDVSPLIPESEYTTYGALNTLEPGQVENLPVSDGYLFD
jgi:hypothetical protein